MQIATHGERFLNEPNDHDGQRDCMATVGMAYEVSTAECLRSVQATDARQAVSPAGAPLRILSTEQRGARGGG